MPLLSRLFRALRPLPVQVLIAIVAGIVVGTLAPGVGENMRILGDIFVKLVRMVIAPVIFVSIVTGIAGMRDLAALGRVAARAFGYFAVLSLVALALGLVMANLVHPGSGFAIAPGALDPGKVADFAAKAHEVTLTGFFTGLVPDTLLSSQTDGNILQVLVVAVLFGVALATTPSHAARLQGLLEDIAAVLFRLVAILMRAAPVGAFGAMAFTVGKFGLAALAHLAALVATFYLTSLLFVFGVLGLVARVAGFSIFRLVRYLGHELLLVFGTSSSESALPGLMEKLEAAGCPRAVVGVVVPTGYSFNLDGTNIYMTLAALFIAQACHVELTAGQQILLLGVAMLSSKGAAGVTGAGFITLAATLAIVPAVPIAGMTLILGVDRFMSECRSLTNFMGNAVACIVVSWWEGTLDRERLSAALSPARR
ncbi:C4-dicarboxylate transport protein [Novosphingobium nitrogenifigens DSM 19370]|uniref:C4-dicarboxylate transport protein n=1 Tax=Novosphingobium nitrogenifigens DSM 19370 TaxID=983920 RepID=F1ZDN0_9SPHN|nr:C4-dicarboxylate transporter DctA [Novosphingobium nitrogenifigens]EGD57386.1 C4-dicarboxylate transport protein [Novosphingobium nitrogenifigens DSM 19370]